MEVVMLSKTLQQSLDQLMEEVRDLAVTLREKHLIARGLEDRAGAVGETEVADKALEVHMALEKAVNTVGAIK